MNIINIKDTSNKLFFIGGVVRDELLGRESFDIDITYVGNAIEYCSKFGEVIQVNPDFGTVRVKVKQHEHGIDPLPNFSLSHSDKDEIQPSPLEREEFIVDFASTRSESYPRKGHLPVVEKIGCTLKEDVMRRDFTINALAKSVTTGEIVDYTGGLEDLKNKTMIMHIDGTLFFGSASQIASRIDDVLDNRNVILDCSNLKSIDISAVFAMEDLILTLKGQNVRVIIIFNNRDVAASTLKLGLRKLISPNDIAFSTQEAVESIQN